MLAGALLAASLPARGQEAAGPVTAAQEVQAAQDSAPADNSQPQNAPAKSKKLPRVGVGLRLSSLGVGGEVAVRVTHSTNVRGGFNFFSYSRGYDNNGIHYDGELRWSSAEGHFDWFPLGHSIHLSPGFIAYNNNHVDATAVAPGGTRFTLNGVDYQSDLTDPVHGSAKLSFNKSAPTMMIGFGNLVPRNGKHFSFNIEAGVAFEGSPKIALNLVGTACDSSGLNCANVGTDPTIQANVKGQQAKISNDLSPFKYYPLVSVTLGYSF
jgi:hypothetical protein